MGGVVDFVEENPLAVLGLGLGGFGLAGMGPMAGMFGTAAEGLGAAGMSGAAGSGIGAGALAGAIPEAAALSGLPAAPTAFGIGGDAIFGAPSILGGAGLGAAPLVSPLTAVPGMGGALGSGISTAAGGLGATPELAGFSGFQGASNFGFDDAAKYAGLLGVGGGQQQQQPQQINHVQAGPAMGQAQSFASLAPQMTEGYRPTPTSAIFEQLRQRGLA